MKNEVIERERARCGGEEHTKDNKSMDERKDKNKAKKERERF